MYPEKEKHHAYKYKSSLEEAQAIKWLELKHEFPGRKKNNLGFPQ